MSFTGTILHEGNINTILGVPGSGKTSFSTFVMEKGVDHGFQFATNIHFFKRSQINEAIEAGRLPELPYGLKYIPVPPQINTCTTLSDILLKIINGKKNAVFIDEAGIFASSTAPMATFVRQMKELAYIIRHLNSSYNLIGQAKKSIAPDLRETLVTYEMRVKKITKEYRSVNIYEAIRDDNEEDKTRMVLADRIGRLPLSRLPWDGYFIPKFKFDIDTHECYDKLGDYNSLEVLDHAEDIIKGLKEEKQEEEKKLSPNERREEAYDFAKKLINEEGYTKRKKVAAKMATKYKRSLTWAYKVLARFDDEIFG